SSLRPKSVSLTAGAAVSVAAQGCATQQERPPAVPPPSAPPGPQAPPAQTAGVPPRPEPGASPVGPPPKPVRRNACIPARLSAHILGPRRVIAGQQATWRIRVRNAGRTTARSLRVTDRLPAGFSLV